MEFCTLVRETPRHNQLLPFYGMAMSIIPLRTNLPSGKSSRQIFLIIHLCNLAVTFPCPLLGRSEQRLGLAVCFVRDPPPPFCPSPFRHRPRRQLQLRQAICKDTFAPFKRNSKSVVFGKSRMIDQAVIPL